MKIGIGIYPALPVSVINAQTIHATNVQTDAPIKTRNVPNPESHPLSLRSKKALKHTAMNDITVKPTGNIQLWM